MLPREEASRTAASSDAPTPKTYTVTVPELFPKPRRSGHWAHEHKLKARWARDFAYLFRAEGCPKAVVPCHRTVTITRHHPGVAMDTDNLFSTAKVPLDAMCKAGVLWDDAPAFCTLAMLDVPGAKESKTVITVDVGA